MNVEELGRKRFTFLGGGIIAEVFMERLLQARVTEPGHIAATDINPERLDVLRRRNIPVAESNLEGARRGDILFLAVPPQAVEAVVAEVAPVLHNGQILVSLAAAVPTWLIEDAARKPVPVVRMIPNTPSLIGKGMNLYCLGRHVSPSQAELIGAVLDVFGAAMRIDERLMNVATALTAVGPAYIFPVIQALQDSAVAKGSPRSRRELRRLRRLRVQRNWSWRPVRTRTCSSS